MVKKLVAIALAALMVVLVGCTGVSGKSASTASSSAGPASSTTIPASTSSSGSARTSGDDSAAQSSVLVIKAGGKSLRATFADTVSAKALKELLEGGSVTLQMDDYGDFEKIGEMPMSQMANDEEMTVGPGDIVLYETNKISIIYGTNKWSYTRIGKIEGATRESILSVLGTGPVEVTLSLAN